MPTDSFQLGLFARLVAAGLVGGSWLGTTWLETAVLRRGLGVVPRPARAELPLDR